MSKGGFEFPRVSIIILNWNGWEYSWVLKSLYRITYPNYEVVVVDNASQDGSSKIDLNRRMILIKNRNNHCFAGGE